MIEKYQLHSEIVEPNINKKIPKIAKSTCRQTVILAMRYAQ